MTAIQYNVPDARFRTSGAPADEADLLSRLRQRDATAFDVLVRRHSPRMLAAARRILPCEQDAADAVQEAFISAFESLADFEGSSSLGTWLHRIVVNASLMKLRAIARRKRAEADACSDSVLLRTRDTGASDAVADNEMRANVRAAISRLTESYRQVLQLRDIDEMDTDQAARALRTTAGNIKTRLHRARQALREILAPPLRRAIPAGGAAGCQSSAPGHWSVL